MEKKSIEYLIIAVIIVAAIAVLSQFSQPNACTMEAKICSDGSAVGRVPPDCDFAPCPGDVCCHSFGYGSGMVRCCDEYQWTTPEECTVPEGFVGGGKEIVNDSFCKSTVCPEIECIWDPCPGNHIPGANGCISCASPCGKSCTCPEGYVQEGDVCNPKCYYSTPKCLAPSISCSSTCESDSDCIGTECCHPTSCINKAYKGVCNMLCTQVCQGPLDCGAGSCSCVNDRCTVVPK